MSIFSRRTRAFLDGRADVLRLFERAGANIVEVGELLARLMLSWPDEAVLREQIKEREQDGDRLTEQIANSLHSGSMPGSASFDALALASALDDVVDYAEEAADLLGLYQIEAPMDQAQDLSGVLRDACASLGAGLGALARGEPMRDHLADVHRLENDGDRIARGALASLFDGGIDPVLIIRWKDIFERVEEAIDACEHAATMLQGIAVRYA